MLKRKALKKDTFREIKYSISRFISIMAIIALGSGFYAGLKSTCPDMKDTAHDYFVEKNLMDIKLMSTIGISPQDVSAVNQAEGVSGVMPSYTKDLFLQIDDENLVLRAMSYNKNLAGNDAYNLNRPQLIEGRMPEKSGECVVERKLTSPPSLSIGNKIRLTSPREDEPLSKFLKKDTYEIVGIVSSPLFIGYKKGTTNVGNGEITSFVMLPEEDFSMPYYTELYATIDGLDKLKPFSDEYKKKTEEYKSTLKDVLAKSVNVRFDELMEQANDKIEKAKRDLDSAEYLANADMKTLQSDISNGEAELKQLRVKLAEAEKSKSASQTLLKAAVTQGEKKIKIAKDKIEMIKNGTLPSKEEIDKKIQGYKDEITAAEAQIAAIKDPAIYSFNRFASDDYSSFSEDSEKVDAIAKIFPVFFILVAALVCLTTMTRMVEENRTQIGTYKSLGYGKLSIASKFLFYGLSAAFLGCAVGLVIGFKAFPKLIFNSYRMMYNIPDITAPFRWGYASLTILTALLCTAFAVIYSCLNELKSNPAQIMRPKAPLAGKRVLLEKIPLVWNKLSFLTKVTIRNLLRYKKRFFMTIIGISGCTALMVAGFGLNSSISSIALKQFDSVFIFDGIASVNPEADFADAEASFKDERVSDSMPCYMSTINVTTKNGTRNANLLIPSEKDKLSEFISLQTRKGNDKIVLGDDGVVINEKLSILLDLKVGDTITLERTDSKPCTAVIKGINENYTMHYVYMTPKLYQSLYSAEPKYNSIAFNMNDHDEATEKALSTSILQNKSVLGIQFSSQSSKTFMDITTNLNSIVLVLIICAGILAFIVLYNLSNINISERVRELATIKLLGFYDNEVSAYIYRENTVSAFFGMLLGLVLGAFLHRFVIVTAEIDLVMFDRSIEWHSFLYSGIITMIFTLVVNVVLHFKLKKIDMVGSLKSID